MDRRQMLKATASAGLGVAAAGGALATPALAQGKVKWRLATTQAANAPLGLGAKVFADTVKAATEGAVEIDVYGVGELVPPFEVFDSAASGTIEVGQSYPTFWTGKNPAFNMVGPAPFGLSATEQQAWLTAGGGLEACDEVYAQHNLKFFPLGGISGQSFGWFNRELNSMEDFQGLKMRIGGIGGDVMRRAGATVVRLPLGEVLQSLQTGAIDAAEFVNPSSDMAFGLYRVAKYYYWPSVIEPCGFLDMYINRDAWDALTDSQRDAVTKAALYANFVATNDWEVKNAQALATLQSEHGTEVKILPDDVLKALGKISGEALTAAAEADPLSKKILKSMLDFRAHQMPYNKLSQAEFIRARALDYPYVSL